MAVAALGLVPAMGSADGGAPARVVSLNLCTDQLAMMLAAPGQLVAVSALAREPQVSAMVAAAQEHPVTHGGAEEVFGLAPDLVLAGSYTTAHTTAMLRRLGVTVAEFTPATTLADIRAHIIRIGDLLGREAQAAGLLAEFDADLAALRGVAAARPRAALFQANGYTAGNNTLAGEILAVAGFANVAAEAGLAAGGSLPLETLIMLAPEMVITGTRYPGASRAEAMMDHPALTAFRAGRAGAVLSDADWVCGTPHVLRAVNGLVAAREALP